MKALYIFFIAQVLVWFPTSALAAYHFSDFVGSPPLRVYATTGLTPVGMTPDQIKAIYHLPSSGGKGTIALITAYPDPKIEQDLAAFDKAFNLPPCTSKNGCLKRHLIGTGTREDAKWDLETALDVEWAHAIAPTARILLVEATTPSGANLLKALDYAAKQKEVRAISMSWGGAEFAEEMSLDSHFRSVSNAPFFAASGDKGAGVSWPAASPNVIGVGGTTLSKADGTYQESAWSGSGGGISLYERAPPYQQKYAIPKANGMRAVPDVSYDADPVSGFPVVHNGIWRTVGGTSAGAPQWAAIATLANGITLTNLYSDKSSPQFENYFRDIVTGSNGACGYYCSARARYDYVTGLGSPQTADF